MLVNPANSRRPAGKKGHGPAPRFALLALVFILAGCAAAARWQHPSLTQDQWPLDASACRGQAGAIIDRETRIDTLAPPRNETRLQSDLNLFEIRKRQSKLFAECMTRKGYQKIKPTGADA